ncbi:MAG: class I SAM-dependent RNA methyltransferase [Brachybacterium sp.]|nr:class I SAM-dependent RNA methyltransferase [Brachybacterium sp.]
MAGPEEIPPARGTLLTLQCGKPAHGGTFVARHEGRVVFVRGAGQGETVIARLVEDDNHRPDARFWRAETVEVLEPSPDRVPTVWPQAGTDGVGGADWAHIALPAQRRYASEIVQELLQRARVTTFPLEEVQVEPAPGESDGLGWRTRVRFAVDAETGRIGMRGWRSHEVHDVGANPLAHPSIGRLDLTGVDLPAGVEAVDAVAPSDGPPALVLAGADLDPSTLTPPATAAGWDLAVQNDTGLHPLVGDGTVRESVDGRGFAVAAGGFWQVHRNAATLLSHVVEQDLDVQPGDTAWDLYGGVGLFAASAAERTGARGHVITVEGNRRASALAAENLADLPAVRAESSDCTAWVRAQDGADRVVLDPPRAGAGPELMELLARSVRHRIVYVSCEPSTLARDLPVAEKAGWRITDLRCFDLFPHTHHTESVVVLDRAA